MCAEVEGGHVSQRTVCKGQSWFRGKKIRAIYVNVEKDLGGIHPKGCYQNLSPEEKLWKERHDYLTHSSWLFWVGVWLSGKALT